MFQSQWEGAATLQPQMVYLVGYVVCAVVGVMIDTQIPAGLLSGSVQRLFHFGWTPHHTWQGAQSDVR